jgi:uncharacterized protein (UPF0276 family)
MTAGLGYGLGLRRQHYEDILRERPRVDWFEILTENYLVDGGKPLHYLERIRADYPLAMHGVALSIGGVDPLDSDYLRRVARLAERIEPAWISDHLCWTGIDGINSHDLLPLPFTEEALAHVADRVRAAQDFLGRQLLLENVSSYLRYAHSTIPEWQFLAELAQRADCLLLVDVNNIHVNAINHGFDALDYMRGLPVARVRQLHVAGHLDCGTHLIDTHDRPVSDIVWSLLGAALRRFGPVPVCIERDADVPPLAELLGELETARAIGARALAEVSPQDDCARRHEPDVSIAGLPLRDSLSAVQACVLERGVAPPWVVESATLARDPRIAIYAHAYRARLVEALGHDFGALRQWLGDDSFAELVGAYVGTYPSRRRTLRDVGRELPAFLHAVEPYRQQVALVELARFEWALCDAFDAADAPCLARDDLAALAAAEWPLLRLHFHPSLQCLPLTGNTPARWCALNAGETPPVFVAAERDTVWLVWRHELKLLFRPLDEFERAAFEAFRGGAPFAAVCEQLADLEPAERVPPLLAGLLQRWLEEGLIAARAMVENPTKI